MLTSKDRILTTHCGSLPRPPQLSDLLLRQEAGESIDGEMLRRECVDAISRALQGQMQAGIDVVSDGEQPRIGFSMYIPLRMEGFGGESVRPTPRDSMTFLCTGNVFGKDAAVTIVSPIRRRRSGRSVTPEWRLRGLNTSSSRTRSPRSGSSPRRHS